MTTQDAGDKSDLDEEVCPPKFRLRGQHSRSSSTTSSHPSEPPATDDTSSTAGSFMDPAHVSDEQDRSDSEIEGAASKSRGKSTVYAIRSKASNRVRIDSDESADEECDIPVVPVTKPRNVSCNNGPMLCEVTESRGLFVQAHKASARETSARGECCSLPPVP